AHAPRLRQPPIGVGVIGAVDERLQELHFRELRLVVHQVSGAERAAERIVDVWRLRVGNVRLPIDRVREFGDGGAIIVLHHGCTTKQQVTIHFENILSWNALPGGDAPVTSADDTLHRHGFFTRAVRAPHAHKRYAARIVPGGGDVGDAGRGFAR